MRKTTSGFTTVELLIVIVVIAILAAITIVAYNGIQTRAQASAIISDLKATEKAFNAYKVTSGSGWWLDTDTALTGNTNPSITSIIAAQSEFRNFLQKAPSKGSLNADSEWIYDNDGDTYNGCSASTAGISIAIHGSTNSPLMQAIDSAGDDGNLSCGKIRYSSDGWLLYGLN